MRIGGVATYLVSGMCLVALASPAMAQQKPFDIRAGSLRSALDAYARQSARPVIYKADEIRNARSRGYRGTASVSVALDALLAGTGFTARLDQSGAVAIVRTSTGAAAVDEAVDLANDADARLVDGQDIVVTATGVSHLAERTRTGTRMDADPMTLPLAVSTVKHELIQRQQALTLSDVVSNISGIDSGLSGSVSMRGFNGNVMRNGNLGADGQSNNLPVIAISSVEAVKGPEAIIAGIGAGYGGIVNIISKTPPLTPTAEFNSTVGTRGYFDVGMDVGGPINADKSVLVRLVASRQRAGRTIAGYDGVRSDYFAPSITFRNPDLGTEITAQYEIQNLRRVPDTIVATGGTTLTSDLPIRQLGPRGDGQDVRSRTATISIEQRIVEDWTVALRYSSSRERRFGVLESNFLFDFLLPAPNIITLRLDGRNEGNIQNYKAELRGRFDTGPIEHKLLVSFDKIDSTVLTFNQPVSVLSTNLDTGVTTDQNATFGPIFGVPGPVSGGGQSPRETGILGLDQMTWGNLVVLAGVRRLRYDGNVLNGPPLERFTRLLPSVGAVYRVTPALSLYGNASKGFRPNQGLYTIAGETVSPEDAQQYEVGVKALLFGEKLAATLAYYNIHQKNVATADPDNPFPASLCKGPTQVCYITVAGERSQGAELDLSGRLLPRLEIRGNYRYADVKTDTLAGQVPLYAKHQGSLWATYNFEADRLGLWAGANVKARSAQAGGNLTTPRAKNPGQVRTDLNVGYDARDWSLIAGVKNVFDKRLYTVGSGYFGTGIVDQPREVYATIRYHFW